jgi:hypothetical protein
MSALIAHSGCQLERRKKFLLSLSLSPPFFVYNLEARSIVPPFPQLPTHHPFAFTDLCCTRYCPLPLHVYHVPP